MLSKWLAKRYGIKMLNAEFNKLSNSKKTYRLYIILDSTEDYNKMHTGRFKMNPSYQQTIAKKFSRIALEAGLAEPSTLANVFVVYNDFSEEAKTEANWKAEKEFREFLKINIQMFGMYWQCFLLSLFFSLKRAKSVKMS